MKRVVHSPEKSVLSLFGGVYVASELDLDVPRLAYRLDDPARSVRTRENEINFIGLADLEGLAAREGDVVFALGRRQGEGLVEDQRTVDEHLDVGGHDLTVGDPGILDTDVASDAAAGSGDGVVGGVVVEAQTALRLLGRHRRGGLCGDCYCCRDHGDTPGRTHHDRAAGDGLGGDDVGVLIRLGSFDVGTDW